MRNEKWTARITGTSPRGSCRFARAFVVSLGLALFVARPSRAATPRCDVEGVRLAAPAGMTIGPIDNLSPRLPAVPTGALAVAAASNTPAHCLVTGNVLTQPSSGKTANFGLLLPLAWNGKFLFSGCDGYCGAVFQNPPDATGGGYPSDALTKGYAIAATDGGHTSSPVGNRNDASWALTSPGVPDTEAVTDYFHRAVHSVTVAAKQLVQGWYSRPPARSYFFGCAGGGREGMMEATRHPTDFDGYIAGNPAFDVPGEILGGRGSQALLKNGDAYLEPALLALVDKVVYAGCDDADGVRDRLIQNPGRCSFDPESLLCKGDNGTACLTRNQVDTLNSWFSAAMDETGRVVSHGVPVSDIYTDGVAGNDLFRWVSAAGPPRNLDAAEPWGGAPHEQPKAWSFMDQALRYLVHWDPNFVTRHDPPVNARGVVDDKLLELLVARTDAGSSDASARLGAFIEADRKLILYHGYSDGWISPYRTLRFYQTWAKRVGGYAALKENARLFTVPGMNHCSQGPGPNVFDALGALEQWVEHDIAPEAILATKYPADDTTQPALRAMPLCTYPTMARYAGEGDVNSAASWSCAPNQELLRVGPNGVAAGLVGPTR